MPFSQEAFAWLRGLIAAYLVLDLIEHVVNPWLVSALVRRVMYGGWLNLFLFALYLAPYVFILVRMFRRAESLAAMLAVAYPAASVLWSIYFLTRYPFMYRANPVNGLEMFINSSLEIAIAMVAVRVLRSLAGWNWTRVAGMVAASIAYLASTAQLGAVMLRHAR